MSMTTLCRVEGARTAPISLAGTLAARLTLTLVSSPRLTLHLALTFAFVV